MPLFSYKGIDVYGTIHKGNIVSPTKKHLEAMLFKEGIVALKIKTSYLLYLKFLSLTNKIIFYNSIATLLSSGILLPDALCYLAQHSKNYYFQDLVYCIAEKVSSGEPFYTALLETPFANATILFMIKVGEKSGNLAKTMAMIALYLERSANIKKNLRSVLLMPFITCTVILSLFFIITQVMLPRLLAMLRLFKKDDQNLEKKFIFTVSKFFSYNFFLWLFGITLSLLIGTFFLYKTKHGKQLLQSLILKVPFIRKLIIQSVVSRIFFSLSLLLESGIPLLQALELIKQSMNFYPIQNALTKIIGAVKNGVLLSQAIDLYFGSYDTRSSILLHVAEKTGTLNQTAMHIADNYNTNIQENLAHAIAILQPTLIIFLGLCISLIMIALYGPLMEFSLTI